MRQAPAAALLLALALAIVAPAFAAAPASCAMSCCRTGAPMGGSGMRMGSGGRMPPAPSLPDGAGRATCGLRGCGGEPPVATLSGLPPSVLPALSPLPAPALAAPAPAAGLRLWASFVPDLPEQPP
ncbi:MAG TPA: hypothetical protein VIH93_03865, partial [Thermoanaerobaculia bacterium]